MKLDDFDFIDAIVMVAIGKHREWIHNRNINNAIRKYKTTFELLYQFKKRIKLNFCDSWELYIKLVVIIYAFGFVEILIFIEFELIDRCCRLYF